MQLAVIELDLSILSSLKPLMVLALFGVSAYMLVWPYVKQLVLSFKAGTSDSYKRKDSDRSSDTPPPPGFAEHLQIIEDTAPNANTEVWWQYAKQELTEAEVAIAEAKLARKAVSTKNEV